MWTPVVSWWYDALPEHPDRGRLGSGQTKRADAVNASLMLAHVAIDRTMVVGGHVGVCLVSGYRRWKARVMVLRL